MSYEEYWLQKKNVVAVCEEDDVIQFYVTKKLKKETLQRYVRTNMYGWTDDDIIQPKELVKIVTEKETTGKLKGYTTTRGVFKNTDVIEIGEVKAMGLPNRKQYRPLQPGCEISVERSFNVGTLGCFVKYYSFMGRKLTGQLKSFVNMLSHFGIQPKEHVAILTNNHVVNSNIFKPKMNTIVQPGGRNRSFGVAKTIYNSTIDKHGINEIDASVCELTRDEYENITAYKNVTLRGPAMALNGEFVSKEGRTTGTTDGEVAAQNVSTNIKFGDDLVRFRGLIMSKHIVRPGDSGSVLVDRHNNVVGLIFAASPSMGFAIPIQKVLDDAGVELI